MINEKELPGLYQCADRASGKAQKRYFNGIAWYLILLIVAAASTYYADGSNSSLFNIISAGFFLITLSITIWLKFSKPEDIWYNGRAVAESVKTRTWRWMMRAEPYNDSDNIEIVRRQFISDLRTILKQNDSLIGKIGLEASIEDPISDKMLEVRRLSREERLVLYRKERIENQALWYSGKATFNKKKASFWFWATIVLHAIALILLLYNIKEPFIKLPIEVVAVGASSILTWLQAKKHSELSSSYSLTAHEIILIRSESVDINSESDFSNFIINCENAFSREHTQWFARKSE